MHLLDFLARFDQFPAHRPQFIAQRRSAALDGVIARGGLRRRMRRRFEFTDALLCPGELFTQGRDFAVGVGPGRLGRSFFLGAPFLLPVWLQVVQPAGKLFARVDHAAHLGQQRAQFELEVDEQPVKFCKGAEHPAHGFPALVGLLVDRFHLGARHQKRPRQGALLLQGPHDTVQYLPRTGHRGPHVTARAAHFRVPGRHHRLEFLENVGFRSVAHGLFLAAAPLFFRPKDLPTIIGAHRRAWQGPRATADA